MKIITPLLLFLCWFASAEPEAQSTQTKGACSPIVTGNGNTITIKTCGMTKDEVEEWRSSFRKILEQQVDAKVLVALLDDIKSGQIRIENGVLQIQGQVGRIARGSVETYDYNGMKRIQSRPGFIDLEPGENASFQEIHAAYDAKDWGRLGSLCEQEIRKMPSWLTPYLFAGVAYANTNRKDDAIKALTHVVEEAGDDPAYQDAKRILQLVQSRK